MTVLVTGGAGFIGSNLVDTLMSQGMEVRVLDDLSEGREENLSRWRKDPKFQMIKGSILDFELVKRACDHVSCIFHLAADSRIQTGISDARHSIMTNVVGTANVAEAARQMDVKRIVYSASSSVYGRKNNHVLDKGRGLDEELPTDCLNPYSLSKKSGEDIMDVYHRLYGISTVSLRYFNVYGPRHQEEGRYSTVIAIFRRQLRHGKPMTVVGDGTQRRDFTFVGDVVHANMLAMMNRNVTGTLNIGSGSNMSINALARLVAWDFEGRPSKLPESSYPVEYLPPRLGEADKTLADVSKASELLGWYPKIDLLNGLEVLGTFEKNVGYGSSGIILL
jgi:nucleoside-diphosphate-sugar epimerase